MAFDLDDDELRATRKLNGVEWEEDFVTDKNFGNKVGELEEISANEIIRTTEGKLYSIVSATEDDFLCNELNGKSNRLRLLSDLEIKNHKIDIIDLIEVGDYVNGYEAITVYGYDEDGNDKDGLGICQTDDDYAYYTYLEDIDIKTIVTHEQFNSVMYRTGE